MVAINDSCGRRGCGKAVANGMQCVDCTSWFHVNCTGLSELQYTRVSTLMDFKCMACRVQKEINAPNTKHTGTQTDEVRVTESERSAICSTTELTLRETCDHLQDTHREIKEMIAVLKAATPSLTAAESAVKITDQAIRDAATALEDCRMRATRIILWGKFLTTTDPFTQASTYLKGWVDKVMHADWLRSKRTKKPVGILATLPSTSHTKRAIDNSDIIMKAHPSVTKVARDIPLLERKAVSTRTAHQDRRRMQEPIVVLSPLKQSVTDLPSATSTPTRPDNPIEVDVTPQQDAPYLSAQSETEIPQIPPTAPSSRQPDDSPTNNTGEVAHQSAQVTTPVQAEPSGTAAPFLEGKKKKRRKRVKKVPKKDSALQPIGKLPQKNDQSETTNRTLPARIISVSSKPTAPSSTRRPIQTRKPTTITDNKTKNPYTPARAAHQVAVKRRRGPATRGKDSGDKERKKTPRSSSRAPIPISTPVMGSHTDPLIEMWQKIWDGWTFHQSIQTPQYGHPSIFRPPMVPGLGMYHPTRTLPWHPMMDHIPGPSTPLPWH